MAIWKDLLGTVNSYFKVGFSGFRLKNNSGAAEIKNTGDTDWAVLRAKNIASGGAVNDVATLLDLQGRLADIEFSFGTTDPSAGSNTGKFGFCRTDSTSYSAGDIVYDTGSAIVEIPSNVCKALVTRTAITGTISLDSYSLYENQGGTWTKIGGGSTGDGDIKVVKTAFTYSNQGSNVDSSESIPEGKVLQIRCVVTTAFNGSSPTIGVTANGSTPKTLMTTSQNLPGTTGDYQVDDTVDIASVNSGALRVAVGGSGASTGVGYCLALIAVGA